MFSMGSWRGWMFKPGRLYIYIIYISALVANQILKNGMFSNNTAKNFSQRSNKYNYRRGDAILR
jgi:hypothetical protein